MKKLLSLVIAAGGLFLGSQLFAASPDSPHLHPITWKGDKWEYLVEYPRDISYIHPTRFEEVLDDAGQHGWELTSVSHENHFYVFYFKRPLLAHKITEHRARLHRVKQARSEIELANMQRIVKAHKQKLMLEKLYSQEVEKVNQELKEQVQLEKQADAELVQENKDLAKEITLTKQEDTLIQKENQDLAKKVQLEEKAKALMSK